MKRPGDETENRSGVTRTISLPDELLEKALERSKREDRSFSSYVRNLIARDLNGELQVPEAEPKSAKAA
jgi:predicted CopG family antitoxin